MVILNSKGLTEQFNPKKITDKINKYSEGLTVDADKISKEVITRLPDETTTIQIDELTANTAASYSIEHPDYSKLAGRIVVDRLHKSTDASLLTVVRKLHKQGLIKQKYYDIVTQNTKLISKTIDYNRDFHFNFFGISTMKEVYLLKVDNKVVERPQHLYMRVAINLTDNIEEAIDLYELLSNQMISPASPILFNSGTKNQTLISCNLITSLLEDNDSLEGIHKSYEVASKLSSRGAGLGVHLSDLRSAESVIKSSGGKAAGILKQLKVYNALMIAFDQSGRRKGAAAMYLDIWHKDLMQFLDAKKPTGAEELRARDLFYGLCVQDEFMRRLENDEDWYLICPNDYKDTSYYDGRALSTLHNEEFETTYKNLIKSYEKTGFPKLTKVKATDVWKKIFEIMHESGSPYILFKDAMNRSNMQSNIGSIKQSNLCVSGDTKILTDKGSFRIDSIVNTEVNVWNMYEYSKVTIRKTADNAKFLKVTVHVYDEYGDFECEKILNCTADHEWLTLRDGFTKTKTTALLKGDTVFTVDLDDDGKHLRAEIYKIEDEKLQGISYCFTEPKRGMGTFNGIITFQCSEISLYTDHETVANCVLSAIPINKYINKEGELDYKALEISMTSIVKYLNKVVDINDYPTPEARKGGLEQRALGIGYLGFADTCATLKIAYDSDRAKEISYKISEAMYYYALKASNQYAIDNEMSYPYFEGSPYSKGFLHYDLVDKTEHVEKDSIFDWKALKISIKKYGIANSTLLCMMPNAGTSQLLDLTESAEPTTNNIFVRKTMAGEFIVINKYLVRELEELGLWIDEIKTQIKLNEGSILNVDLKTTLDKLGVKNSADIEADLQFRYRTVWELRQRAIINLAAERQIFIDQTQSMNLWLASPTLSRVASMILYGWKANLKTGIYYLRSRSKNKADATLGVNDISCFGCES